MTAASPNLKRSKQVMAYQNRGDFALGTVQKQLVGPWRRDGNKGHCKIVCCGLRVPSLVLRETILHIGVHWDGTGRACANFGTI